MQIIDSPYPRFPHACAVTLRDDTPAIDTGIEIQGLDPHLYLRVTVVEELGRMVGMVPKAQVDELEHQIQTFAAEIAEMRRRLDVYESAESALAELRALNPEPVTA